MPSYFKFKGKTYHWYRTLPRTKKRYLKKLFLEHEAEIQPIRKEQSEYKIKGFVFMLWDERSGPSLIGSYPENFSISQATLIQIYANYLAMNSSGIFNLEVDSLQFSSYKIDSSPDTQLFFILQTEEAEDLSMFDKFLIKTGNLLMQKPELIFEVKMTSSIEPSNDNLEYWLTHGNISPKFLTKLFQSCKKVKN